MIDLHAVIGQVELVEDRDDDRHDRLALGLDRQLRVVRSSEMTSLRNCGVSSIGFDSSAGSASRSCARSA